MAEALEEFPTYPNPPIKEAVLQLNTLLPNDTTIEELAKIHEQIGKEFPEKEERLASSFQVGPKKDLPPSLIESKIDGVRFRSPKDNKVLQISLNEFTFNKLKPYDNWKTYSSEALELWKLYCQLAKPIKVTQISLRYINTLEIPLPIKDLKEYIRTYLEIPSELPQKLKHFFIQFTVEDADIGARAKIIQTIQNPTESILPLILDIDVIKTATYKPEADAIWEDFNSLRYLKNKIFNYSITDKTKEMFT